MKRNRCPYPVKDTDLKSPNPKDSRSTEAKPAQANPCVRRNLARDFENPSEDQSSGDDSVEMLSEEEPCGEEYTDYYDEAERLPIYKKVTIGLSSLELVQIIVGQDFGREKVCKVKPVAVHHNVTFVIDLKHVALKDLGADDNGAWQISCPKQRFQIFREDGHIKSICRTKDYGEGIITLRRQYAHHKATKKERNVIFTRIISSAFDEKGLAFRFAVVQVCFHIHIFCDCEAVYFFRARTQKCAKCAHKYSERISHALVRRFHWLQGHAKR
ncbi:uncharacterized protein LOC114970661 [Acropora millepora]|uniref:uncharacterized protein LOC114970661 n=1 Tax=Acropora millepora TaxID=45264 RepID=UPI001CF2A8F4|nr:uncharacterized protein LOC114970661 [Acropora millepora]